jgi:hypothetical protein
MKKFIFIAILLSLAVHVSAQQDTSVYDYPDSEAAPKQGLNEFCLSLFDIFDVIEITEDQDISCLGRLHIMFIVEIDGTITHLNCIDHCGHTFNSVLLVDRFKEKWIPATNNEKAVRSKYHIPINVDYH